MDIDMKEQRQKDSSPGLGVEGGSSDQGIEEYIHEQGHDRCGPLISSDQQHEEGCTENQCAQMDPRISRIKRIRIE